MLKYTYDEAILRLIKEKLITVYQDGLVYNNARMRYFDSGKPNENKSFSFRYEGESYATTKTRLLWLAFNGPVPEKKVVCVVDFDKPIALDNIELMTLGEAAARRPVVAKIMSGEDSFFARFTNEQVLALRREYKVKPFALRPRAKELLTDHNTLSNLLSGKTYKDVPEPCIIVRNNKPVIDRSDPDWLEKEKERKRLYMQSRRDKGLVKPSTSKKPKAVVKKPLYNQTSLGNRVIPEVYHDRKRLEREASELLKKARVIQKPVKEPKPKVVKEPKVQVVKPVVETPINSVNHRQDWEKIRLQREANAERIEALKLERQLEQARKEKESNKRLDLIKAMAEKRKASTSSNLTPFKQFAAYHLHSRFGESFEEIGKLISVADINLVELAYKSFDPGQYEVIKNSLIEKHGRDSTMLSRIRMFEGVF